MGPSGVPSGVGPLSSPPWAPYEGAQPTPQLKSPQPAPWGQGPPPRWRGEGGMVGSIPHRRPLPPRAREGVPLRVRPQATERTGQYPRSSYPAPPARGPPSRCRGRRGTLRSTPHRRPLGPRRREGAPLGQAHRPHLQLVLSGLPSQGPPFSMPGPKGHA